MNGYEINVSDKWTAIIKWQAQSSYEHNIIRRQTDSRDGLFVDENLLQKKAQR